MSRKFHAIQVTAVKRKKHMQVSVCLRMGRIQMYFTHKAVTKTGKENQRPRA